MVNQDYECDGKSYKIVQDLVNFIQVGFVVIYDVEFNSNLIVSGEVFDLIQLIVVYLMLLILSYVWIINFVNGWMIVVWINDCGFYGNDWVILFFCVFVDCLNIFNNIKVCIDFIIVVFDGLFFGLGMVCIIVVKQIYVLFVCLNLDGGDVVGMS